MPSDQEFQYCHQYLTPQTIEETDLFELVTLEGVLKICSESKNLADAGRKLFSQSRQKRKGLNDSDRLKKYLATYLLEWAKIKTSH